MSDTFSTGRPIPYASEGLLGHPSGRRCKVVQRNQAFSEIFYHGKALKVASDRTFDAWETTIINDENFAIRKNLERWINLVSKPDLNTRDIDIVGTSAVNEGTNADYKTDLNVTQYSKNGKSLQTYYFRGAFPTSISSIPLSWESSAIETYTCNWAYDHWDRKDVLGGDETDE